MIGALGKMHEWELHCRGAIGNGVTKEELRAIVHVIGICCGVPQAMECLRSARKVLEEERALALIRRQPPGHALHNCLKQAGIRPAL